MPVWISSHAFIMVTYNPERSLLSNIVQRLGFLLWKYSPKIGSIRPELISSNITVGVDVIFEDTGIDKSMYTVSSKRLTM